MRDDLGDLTFAESGLPYGFEISIRDLTSPGKHLLREGKRRRRFGRARPGVPCLLNVGIGEPVSFPIAVCADAQYWQAFCSPTVSAISSRSLAGRLPPASAPLNDRYASNMAEELAITRVMFGVILSLDCTDSSICLALPLAVSV